LSGPHLCCRQVNGRIKVILRTTRPIAAEEEILLDYGDDEYWEGMPTVLDLHESAWSNIRANGSIRIHKDVFPLHCNDASKLTNEFQNAHNALQRWKQPVHYEIARKYQLLRLEDQLEKDEATRILNAIDDLYGQAEQIRDISFQLNNAPYYVLLNDNSRFCIFGLNARSETAVPQS